MWEGGERLGENECLVRRCVVWIRGGACGKGESESERVSHQGQASPGEHPGAREGACGGKESRERESE